MLKRLKSWYLTKQIQAGTTPRGRTPPNYKKPPLLARIAALLGKKYDSKN